MANACISCQRTIEPPALRGTLYNCKSESTGATIQFWMCNPCAIPLGPGQGPIPKFDPKQKPRIPGDDTNKS
ncbi:MAG TPA: hypothetical protein VFB81_15990 [Myxococcales bacterium]|nr:hypothetical protein [Myxococcales bacterium]